MKFLKKQGAHSSSATATESEYTLKMQGLKRKYT